ncbi:MAG: GAF domain-containing protein [Magnetococcales bacterium]|nr:GAF domain-containing protein [Magnetococcales bacterium]
MEFDIFGEEEAALDRARVLLADSGASPEALREGFSLLVGRYGKLSRDTRRLVRISDRSEHNLKLAHEQIRAQKAELELAHDRLSRQADILETMVQERTRDLVRTQAKLEKLVELGIAMAAQRDIGLLLDNILQGARELTRADGGILFLRDADDRLRYEIVRIGSLDLVLGGPGGPPITFNPLSLAGSAPGEGSRNNVAVHAALHGAITNVADAYQECGFDFSVIHGFDARTGYRSRSFLTVPLKPRQGPVVGVLQLINAQDPATGAVIGFDPEIEGFVEALAALAALTLDNQKLLNSQKELFNAFIRLIAAAIDAKSPYTGGHCERVPEVARMLAEAAHRVGEGPLRDFSLTEADRHHIHLASWLHDCGKVTTPEYVVDKATKLETIHNRIHEVRTRFEVLRRDAEIRCLREQLAGGVAGALQERFQREVAVLEEEFAFIAECNIGGEFMDPARRDRVREIAGRTWIRHFDDRKGLSHGEMTHRRDISPVPVPAVERLLDDKPEQVIPRAFRGLPDQWRRLGIRMQVPEALYNYGEVYNLCIGRGTLTDEERFKVNEHIIQTIVMLDQLPFPADLRPVPEYAGAHHETMIGTGYPRGLKRQDMSIPARIMSLADIFEALTATDRPYKEPKTLSQALRIMHFMKKDGHIDPDLFDLFLTQGVYRDYADRFMRPEQIDAVRVEDFLGG